MKCGHFKATEETMGDYYKKHRQELELYNSWLIVGKRVDEVMREEILVLGVKLLLILLIGLGFILFAESIRDQLRIALILAVVEAVVFLYLTLWEGR